MEWDGEDDWDLHLGITNVEQEWEMGGDGEEEESGL